MSRGPICFSHLPPSIAIQEAAAYNRIRIAIRRTIGQPDAIFELLIDDVAFRQWEVSWYLRAKWHAIRCGAVKKLAPCLQPMLEPKVCYRQHVALIESMLRQHLSKMEGESVEALARACVFGEPDAVRKVNKILAGTNQNATTLASNAQLAKAMVLVRLYFTHGPNALQRLINAILTGIGLSFEDFMAEVISEKLDEIERIDRLISLAESRRDASLREIERRHAGLTERLRRSLQQLEQDERRSFETIHAKGNDAS
jgi:hypothetical protein